MCTHTLTMFTRNPRSPAVPRPRCVKFAQHVAHSREFNSGRGSPRRALITPFHTSRSLRRAEDVGKNISKLLPPRGSQRSVITPECTRERTCFFAASVPDHDDRRQQSRRRALGARTSAKILTITLRRKLISAKARLNAGCTAGIIAGSALTRLKAGRALWTCALYTCRHIIVQRGVTTTARKLSNCGV